MPTTWTNRDNVDPSDWSNRRVTSSPGIVGSGSSGFLVFSLFLDGKIMFKPRHVRYGEIYAGRDEWTKRGNGTAVWEKRLRG